MAVSFSVDPVDLTRFAAGLVMLGLAGFLLYLDFENRPNRAFSLFLILRGLLNVVNAIELGPRFDLTVSQTIPYFNIATPFATLYFAYAYRVRYGPQQGFFHTRWAKAIPGTLLVLFLFFEGLYFADHALWYPKGPNDPDFTRGYLFIFDGLRYATYALVAFIVGYDFMTSPPSPRRSSLLHVAQGFAMNTVYVAGLDFFFFDVFGFDISDAGPGALPNHYLYSFSLLPILVLVGLLIFDKRHDKDPEFRPNVNRFLVILPLPAISALILVLFYAFASQRTLDELDLDTAFEGIWTLALPLYVVYALLRYQLFGIEYKLKFTIKQSTVGASFVATFFVVSEGAQAVFSTRVGPYLGIIAAGMLVFAIAPLQQFAERVASAAVPGATPIGEMNEKQKRSMYREWVEVAWEDRILTKKDRKMLEVARSRLGLSFEDAARIDRQVMAVSA